MPESEFYLKAFHEIKNSVTLIEGYLQLLEKNYPSLSQYDFWKISRTETARLHSMLVELSQLKPKNGLHPKDTDLREFLAGCSQILHPLKGKKDIRCQITMPKTPLIASVDSPKLRQAITNLLKNACEAMEYSGTINIHAFQNGTNAYITITDSGCGISSDSIAYIFDPFTTTKRDGSGLGLNITKQIICAHQGSITVRSSEGEGTSFTITLPLIA